VDLVHSLVASGALTAIAFAELHGCRRRLLDTILFGPGSIAGIALASGAAEVTPCVIFLSDGARRGSARIAGGDRSPSV
jgi:hypothetical protein